MKFARVRAWVRLDSYSNNIRAMSRGKSIMGQCGVKSWGYREMLSVAVRRRRRGRRRPKTDSVKGRRGYEECIQRWGFKSVRVAGR